MLQQFEVAVEQPKTCATCPNFKPHDDGTDKGWCCLFNHYSRESHSMTGDCINTMQDDAETDSPVPAPSIQIPVVQSGSITFKRVLSANPAKTIYEVFRGVDSLGLVVKSECGCWYNSNSDDYVDGYATPYEAAAALLPTNPASPPNPTTSIPEIEVDSDVDLDFGTLYRVWYSYHLLGTFYQAADGKWIAQPCSSDDRPRCNTSLEAQLIIVAISGLLVADTADDVVDLLDKPFDELTFAEWTSIKLAAQQSEKVAA